MAQRLPLRTCDAALKAAGPSRAPCAVTLQAYRFASSQAATKAGPSKTASTAVPRLPRPLGVHEPPVAEMKTFNGEERGMFNSERRKAERKELLREAGQGYFHDYNRARKGGGGKLWMAPSVLIREDMALYFPNIAGTTLAGEKACTTEMFKGKTSLAVVLNTRLSEEHAESFARSVLDDQEGKADFQYVQINHQQNPLKATLISFFNTALKRTQPEHLWRTYLMARGEWSQIDINHPLGIENKLLGYIFLVDSECRIRWAGCGLATPEERQGLRAATEVLMRRTAEKKS